MQTQWRTSYSGYTGLDYNVLYEKFDRRQITGEDADRLEDDVRTMELEALATMQEAAEDQRKG